jgi:ribosomal-protein-alanine N-acetyltransferase
VAGFCWIEERGRVLHLHGLILRKEFQGRGIGGRVLEMLETRFSGRVDTIELGVHRSNTGAVRLYERTGYRTAETRGDLGFLILRKDLADRGNL